MDTSSTTGHSLGGAVAVLPVSCGSAFPTPRLRASHLGAQVAWTRPWQRSAAWTTSVVLHDDVIPRITHTSVRDLVKELLRQRECCMGLWHSDLEAVWGRVCGFWSTRWRDSFLRNTQSCYLFCLSEGSTLPRSWFRGHQRITDPSRA